MKKERCMLFFDIDGTLITTDGRRTFPESAKRALREARKRGHLVYINTGRVMANVDDFIREVGFDGYIRPDHGRIIWGEVARPGYGLYDRALGACYLNGLWEAVEKSRK